MHLTPCEIENFASSASGESEKRDHRYLQRPSFAGLGQRLPQPRHFFFTRETFDLASRVPFHASERVRVLWQIAPSLCLAEHGFQDLHRAIGRTRSCRTRQRSVPADSIRMADLVEELPGERMVQMSATIDVVDFAVHVGAANSQ